MKWKLLLCIVLLLTCSSPAYGNAKDETKTGNGNTWYWCWKEYIAVAVLVGAGAVYAFPLVLGAIGFTAAGVAAGSIAAAIQSAVYGGAVASTSIFAVLQSIGAVGLGLLAKVGLFSAFAGAAAYLKSIFAPCVEGPECKPDKK